jgi:tetratricopeptide (TPR) repeat protein
VTRKSGRERRGRSQPAPRDGAKEPQRGRAGAAARLSTIGIPAAIALFALLLRIIYLLELRATPLFHSPGLDSAYYIDRARAIAAGDWIGSEVFFMGPLYPYLLAILNLIVGSSTLNLLLTQSILGSLGPVLLYLLGCRLFDRPTAIAAALGMAAYGMLILYDNQFLMEWLLTLLSLLVLVQLAWVGPRTRTATLVFGGALLGIAALGRASLLLFVPGALVWLWLGGRAGAGAGSARGAAPGEGASTRHPAAKRTRWIAAYLAGVALVITPVTVRNTIVGNDLVLVTSNGGLNFFIGNNPLGRGTYLPLDQVARAAGVTETAIDISWMITDPAGRTVAEAAAGRSLKPSEVSSFYAGRALDYIRSQPGRALRILGRKLLLFWNATEIAQIEDPALYRDLIPLLRAPLVGFGLAGPLALLGFGLALARPRRRPLILVTLFVATFTLSVVLFFVTARYRAPIVPALLLLAAFAAVELVRRARGALHGGGGNLVRTLGWPLAAFAGLAVVAHLNLVTIDRAAAYISLGIALSDEGRNEEAIAALEKAVAHSPRDPVSRYNLGAAFLKAGRLEAAAATFRDAVTMMPASIAGWGGLGESHARLGQAADAAAAFRRAATLAGNDAYFWMRLGGAEFAAGRPDSARVALDRGLALDPGNPTIHSLLEEMKRSQQRNQESF